MHNPENKTAKLVLDLQDWHLVKARGALVKTGAVYRSQDKRTYLRTGNPEAIHQEAEFAKEVWQRGFPVPEVTQGGILPNGIGYFAESSVGEQSFGSQLRSEYENSRAISSETFERYLNIALKFFTAQLRPENRPTKGNQLRDGIQMRNVLDENPDVPSSLLEEAVMLAESRIAELPLVLSHGDFAPFNIMDKGVIDFEHRFIAPFGYDAITAVTFQRFWDHPQPDQVGTMKRWDFSRQQIADYLARVDELCEESESPAVSEYFDDLLMLKSIWALSHEKTDDTESAQARRWLWRKRVVRYCMEQYLAGKPINSEEFRAIGLGESPY